MQRLSSGLSALPSLVKCCLALITITFFLHQFAFHSFRLAQAAPQTSLDHREEGSSRRAGYPGTFQIVIAHKDAHPHSAALWLNQMRHTIGRLDLTLHTTIYTRGHTADLDILQNITQAEDIYRLHNRGRAVGTYLHHIVLNYHDLANFTYFTYDQPVGLNEETGQFDEAHADALRYSFRTTTGFLNHGLNEKDVGWCECGECDRKEGYSFPLMKQIISTLNGRPCRGRQRTVLFNQFIVSRERILSQPKWLYHFLLDLITAPEDHWIHEQKEPSEVLKWMGSRSSPEHPLFLYTVERLWSVLFGCGSDPWAEGCQMFLDKDGPA